MLNDRLNELSFQSSNTQLAIEQISQVKSRGVYRLKGPACFIPMDTRAVKEQLETSKRQMEEEIKNIKAKLAVN